MIIRPCSYDLATAVQRLEEDAGIAFEMTRTTTPLRGVDYKDWPRITTLDITGPYKTYARKSSKGEVNHTGRVWKSEVVLSSRFRTADRAFDHIIDEILGKPCYGDSGDVDGELILRYDFPIDQQPEGQHAPAPHLIYLKVRGRKGPNGRVFGSIGDLRNKILRTPKLYTPFYEHSPEEIALARAELARR